MNEFNNLIDFNDISLDSWNEFYELFSDIIKNPAAYSEKCKGKLMANLFYEASTRTKLSFESAMKKLGGEVIGFDNPQNSSVSKGESLKDTIRIVSSYTDLIVMRNPIEGAAKAAEIFSSVPVINAGDGGHLHPTQTLTDLTTIMQERGRLSGFKIGMCGDLLNGRTVHSLTKALMRFADNEFYFISTKELTIPSYITDILDENGIKYHKVNSLADCIASLDILYMTRIQRERFESEKEYLSQKGVYVLDMEKLKNAKSDLMILHPLPRVDEIDNEVDYDSRAYYFKQAVYGMYARMALILKALENPRRTPERVYDDDVPFVCRNPRCISRHEGYLPKLFKQDGSNKAKCIYCDKYAN